MAAGGLPRYGAQKKYVEGQSKDGLVRVSIWVPKEDRVGVLNYCRKLRNGVKRTAE